MHFICAFIIIFVSSSLTVVCAQLSLFRRPFAGVTYELAGKIFNNTADYIESHGYTAEHHNVISEDGYLISVFRIPSDGFPILFQHGLLLGSDSWVIQGSDYDLAFILADRGYDIWLADNRGNAYSKGHLKLSWKIPKYWDFSFHEMGVYDMPAVVNYILQISKRDNLDIIGHSLGATSAFIMCATHPEYNDKVRSVIALAPAVFYNSSGSTNVHQLLSRYGSYLKYLHRYHNVNEFFPKNDVTNRLSRTSCRNRSPLHTLCLYCFQNVLGFSGVVKLRHKTAVDFSNAVPRGVSYKTLVHLAQLGQSARLSYFDFGPKSNMMFYGTKTSPEYNLSLVTVPVSLIYSEGDIQVSYKDVELLRTQLPNVVASYKIDKPMFNHLDLVWGEEARLVVFDFILEILGHFENSDKVENHLSENS